MTDRFDDEDKELSLTAALTFATQSFCMTLDYLIHANNPLSQEDLDKLHDILKSYYANHMALKRLHTSLSKLRQSRMPTFPSEGGRGYNIVPFGGSGQEDE